MTKTISNFKPIGKINLPGSKSYSHRFLVASFISNSQVKLTNLNTSDDIQATQECIELLKNKQQDNLEINCQSSASTLRMILPLAIEVFGNVKAICSNSLLSRPMNVYEEIFEKHNIQFQKVNDGYTAFGHFQSYDFKLDNLDSSQFISGLLFLIAFKQKGSISWLGSLPSMDYVTMTLKTLGYFGYIFKKGENCISFVSKEETNNTEFIIEPDMSSLPYFAIMGCLHGDVTICDVPSESLQPDYKIVDLLSSIGGEITREGKNLIFKKSSLKAFNFDIENCIDLGPSVCALAACIDGTSTISGFKRLALKESNRISSIKSVLNSFDIPMEIRDDVIEIKGKSNICSNEIIKTFGDHRIAMSASVIASFATGNSLLDGVECVSKSYPNFYKDFDSLRKPLFAVSIYDLKTLKELIGSIDCAILGSKYSCIFNKDFDLDKAIEICQENKVEPIILMNRVFMEDELDEITAFIGKYSNYKFVISDLGIAELLISKGLIKNAIYEPDTLICNSSDLSIYQSYGFDATSMSNEICLNDVVSSYKLTYSNIFYQVFGRRMMFYSKRKLINIYKGHKSIEFENENLSLREKIRDDEEIPTYENDNGFFCFRPYNISLLRDFKSLSFLKYAFFESLRVDTQKLIVEINLFKSVLNQETTIEDAEIRQKELFDNIQDGFSYLDTVYVKEKVHL